MAYLVLSVGLSVGLQRVGKFPGILEIFHGNFREFSVGRKFWEFWKFSIKRNPLIIKQSFGRFGPHSSEDHLNEFGSVHLSACHLS